MKRYRVIAKEISTVSYLIDLPAGSPPPAELENWAEHIAHATPTVVMETQVVSVQSAEPLPPRSAAN